MRSSNSEPDDVEAQVNNTTQAPPPATPLESVFFAIFLLLGGGLAFWTACVGISSYLGKPAKNTQVAERGNAGQENKPVELSDELKSLEKSAATNQNEVAPAIAFADALLAEGLKNSDVGLLMRSVQAYSTVLNKEPDNTKALLGLANVSFESQVFDKAQQYYTRYLALVPTDLKATTDYSLVMVQLGDPKGALEILKPILEKNPTYFPAKLATALALKVSGDLLAAKNAADDALRLAPDEKGREVVEGFLKNIDKPEVVQGTEEKLSPGIAVDRFFREHPIVGPKVAKIQWTSAEVVAISLNDFPVDKMPPFAREKFEQNVRQMISATGEKLEIKLLDSATGNLLLTIKG